VIWTGPRGRRHTQRARRSRRGWQTLVGRWCARIWSSRAVRSGSGTPARYASTVVVAQPVPVRCTSISSVGPSPPTGYVSVSANRAGIADRPVPVRAGRGIGPASSGAARGCRAGGAPIRHRRQSPALQPPLKIRSTISFPPNESRTNEERRPRRPGCMLIDTLFRGPAIPSSMYERTARPGCRVRICHPGWRA